MLHYYYDIVPRRPWKLVKNQRVMTHLTRASPGSRDGRFSEKISAADAHIAWPHSTKCIQHIYIYIFFYIYTKFIYYTTDLFAQALITIIHIYINYKYLYIYYKPRQHDAVIPVHSDLSVVYILCILFIHNTKCYILLRYGRNSKVTRGAIVRN